jgi:hypothetical protein
MLKDRCGKSSCSFRTNLILQYFASQNVLKLTEDIMPYSLIFHLTATIQFIHIAECILSKSAKYLLPLIISEDDPVIPLGGLR